MLVKVVADIDGKKNNDFLETPLIAYPLLGVGVLIGGVIKVPSSWPWWECPEKVTDHSGQEEVLGWRSTYWSSRMKILTYHSCRWDVAIFCQSGWDDWHLLPYIFHSLQGFLGNLARSLGEDATLSDVLQMLDEHYGIVMTFYTLSNKLYSLKQGSGENVAEFGVCLLQQVQILQSEYPGRIQSEHVEEMKCDCFYQGLNPEYQGMLAHKVDG